MAMQTKLPWACYRVMQDAMLPLHCRWYPTLLTLPSGNILIVGGCLVTSGDYAVDLQNPTWQIYNVATQKLTYNSPFPTTILTDQVPYSLYPLMWVLPGTGSVLVRSSAPKRPYLRG